MPKSKPPKPRGGTSLSNFGAAAPVNKARSCVVCGALGGTRVLSNAKGKDPRWRVYINKYGAESLWVCPNHRNFGPKGGNDHEGGRGSVRAGPDPNWPGIKKWHPRTSLTEAEAKAMTLEEAESAAACRDGHGGPFPAAGDQVHPADFLRYIERSNDPRIRVTTALARRLGSGLEVDCPPCPSPRVVTVTTPGGKGTREAFYSAQGIRVTDPRAAGGWVRHDNAALFDQCRRTACQVGNCGRALIPHWWVPIVGGYGAVLCACSSGNPQHRVTISTDSLGPITVSAVGPPPTARSHREWQQMVLAIGCRMKYAFLSWAAVAQGHPSTVSPSKSVWQAVHEEAVPTTVAFEKVELAENGALIHSNSAGGVAPEAQADGAWHQMGNTSNRGLVTLVAVDSMYPGGLVIGNEVMDKTITPFQAALGLGPRWTKASKPMEPEGMREVLKGTHDRKVYFKHFTIDGDSTALVAVAPMIKLMRTIVDGGVDVGNCINHYLKARTKKLHDGCQLKGENNGNPRSLHVSTCRHRRIPLKGGGFGKAPK